jgi:hypothetical protein
MRLLELFSGTHSIGKVAEEKGYEVISVDINDYSKKGYKKPTHKVDILEFDYKQYPIGHFDVIHASPPCCNYSQLQFAWLGRIRKINGKRVIFTREILENLRKESDKLLKKTLEIIDYFKPKYFIIENPNNSQMKNRKLLDNLKYDIADYCMYSDWGYKKPTRFWNNIPNLKLLRCNKKCENIVQGTTIHKCAVGKNGKPTREKRAKKHNKTLEDVGSGNNRLERFRIPKKLINEIFDSMEF